MLQIIAETTPTLTERAALYPQGLFYQILMGAAIITFLGVLAWAAYYLFVFMFAIPDSQIYDSEYPVNEPYDPTAISEEGLVSGIIQGYLSLAPEVRKHIQEIDIKRDWSHGPNPISVSPARCGGMTWDPDNRVNPFSKLRIELNSSELSRLCPGGTPDGMIFANALSGVVYNTCTEVRQSTAVAVVGRDRPIDHLGPLGGTPGLS